MIFGKVVEMKMMIINIIIPTIIPVQEVERNITQEEFNIDLEDEFFVVQPNNIVPIQEEIKYFMTMEELDNLINENIDVIRRAYDYNDDSDDDFLDNLIFS